MNIRTSKTIVFTGGHHNSALVVAKELKNAKYNIVWMGHRHASSLDANISQEYREVIAADITFVDLRSGKMYRGDFIQLFKTIRTFIYCIRQFLANKPSLVVSFGGYLAVPPVLAAWLLRIPSVSHEQTTVMGMANKMILPFVKRMYTTWPIEEYRNHAKIRLIGLPQEEASRAFTSIQSFNEFISINDHKMSFGNPEKPLMVISGGKQGAHIINELIERCLPKLLVNWNIFHQCGSNLATKDYHRLLRRRKKLPWELQKSYVVVDYVAYFQDVLALSTLVIGRSGAHTTMEVLNHKKKMIAIPLPFSYGNEQFKNAQKLVEAGLGFILPQSQISCTKLMNVISLLSKLDINTEKIKQVQSQVPKNALSTMVADIESILT